MRAVDTNVLVRLLARDDPAQLIADLGSYRVHRSYDRPPSCPAVFSPILMHSGSPGL
jgi:hypothetical protein